MHMGVGRRGQLLEKENTLTVSRGQLLENTNTLTICRILCAVNVWRKVLVYADAYAIIFWIVYGRGYAVYILAVFSV